MAKAIKKGKVEAVKSHLSSPWASFVAILVAVLWTIPTFGLFVTSLRPQTGILELQNYLYFVVPVNF